MLPKRRMDGFLKGSLPMRGEMASNSAFDSGTVYRSLRQLEKTGLVSSFWDTSESGPARRMYSLTKAGDLFLSSWIDVLGKYQAVLHKTIEGLDRTQRSAAVDGDEQDEKPRRAARR